MYGFGLRESLMFFDGDMVWYDAKSTYINVYDEEGGIPSLSRSGFPFHIA